MTAIHQNNTTGFWKASRKYRFDGLKISKVLIIKSFFQSIYEGEGFGVNDSKKLNHKN